MILFGQDLLQTYYQKFLYRKLPVWNPYIYSGYPFLAHPYNGVFYPFNPLFFLPFNIAYSISYALHILLAGSFMYLLTHSLLSSICFMFSGFIFNRIWAGHYEVLITSVWIPLVFYFRDNPLLCALVLAIQFFAGHNQTSLFTLIIVGTYTIYKSAYLQGITTFMLFLLFASPQLIPTIWFTLKSTRAKGLPFKYRMYGSLPPSHLVRFIFPDIFGNFLKTGNYGDPILGEVYWEHTYYIGLVPALLVLQFFDYRLLYGLMIGLMIELMFKVLWRKFKNHIVINEGR